MKLPVCLGVSHFTKNQFGAYAVSVTGSMIWDLLSVFICWASFLINVFHVKKTNLILPSWSNLACNNCFTQIYKNCVNLSFMLWLVSLNQTLTRFFQNELHANVRLSGDCPKDKRPG